MLAGVSSGHVDAATRRARAAAQLLHRPRRSLVDTVRHLLAVQAQDLRQAPLALRARSRGLTASAVAAARERGELVRAWGPRGTIHLMAREDVGWLTALTLPASRTTVHRRLAQEGLTGTPQHLLGVVERALSGQGPLTKVELAARLAQLGCPASGQGIVFLAFLASIHGRAVLGPERGHKPTYVHSGDWLGPAAAVAPDRGEALAELAVRYLRAHAPAAPEDLAAWSGLALGECRAAFAAVESRLRRLPEAPLWTLKAQPRGRVGVALLPAFDEYLLGWKDRGFSLAREHARTAAPGGGIIRPVVVADGIVVGTWQPNPVRPKLFGDADPAALAAETADIIRFLEG
jgi:DNA glycosylase AlkZ-like